MDDKTRCQSCGMPVDGAAEHMGTEADGTPASEYCTFCYRKGSFTNPTQTVDAMVQSSIDFMTGTLGFSADQATSMSNEYIRALKRWN